LEWYYDVFVIAFEAKTEPDFKLNSKREITNEKRKTVNTEQLVDKTKEVYNRTYTTKQILDTYVSPLVNQGYIDKTDSDLDKRSNIYYPVIITKNRKLFENEKSNNLPRQRCIFVADLTLYPSKQYLVSKIQGVLRYSETNDVFMMIEDHEGKEITAEELVERYYPNPEEYFALGNKDTPPPDDTFSGRPSSASTVVNDQLQSAGRAEQVKEGSNNPAKDRFSSEYPKSVEITSGLQQNILRHQNLTQIQADLPKKLFEVQKSNNFVYSCYYCKNCRTDLESEYQRHVTRMHEGRLGYPNKGISRIFWAHATGKRWEI
jgi:hypothetical protein